MENNNCFIVGIGASAGGTEALFELFSKLPAGINAAYVIVRHLKRDVPSVMSRLLAKYTRLNVVEIKGGEIAQPGHVYVIPANRKLIIKNRSLYLKSRPSAEIINTAIDTFFISLAEQVKEKAIGVILSGTGTDGIKGVKAIDDNGGMVIVQDPSDARFHELPKNAIHLDHPDYVLPVAAIPGVIKTYIEERERQGSGNS